MYAIHQAIENLILFQEDAHFKLTLKTSHLGMELEPSHASTDPRDHNQYYYHMCKLEVFRPLQLLPFQVPSDQLGLGTKSVLLLITKRKVQFLLSSTLNG